MIPLDNNLCTYRILILRPIMLQGNNSYANRKGNIWVHDSKTLFANISFRDNGYRIALA